MEMQEKTFDILRQENIWRYVQDLNRSYFYAKNNKGEKDLEFVQTLLSVCGAISIVGGAGAIILKVIAPAFKLSKRVEKLEMYNDKDYKRLQSLEEMQKQQSKCLAAMLNHTITGNGIENMKKIRDELLENIIDK